MSDTAAPDARRADASRHRPSPRRLMFGSIANLVIKVVAAAMGVLVAALLARQLGPSDYGSFTTALGMVAIAQALTEFGTTGVAVRDMSGQPERRSVIAGGLIAARVSTSFALVLPLVAGLIVLLPSGSATIAGVLVATTLLLTGLAALQSVAQADLRPEVAAALLLFQSATWLIAVAVLVWLDAGLVAFGGAFAATSALQSLVTVMVMRRYIRVSFQDWRSESWRILRTAIPMGLAGVLTTAYYRIDAVLVYELAGADEAGFYNAAYRFLDVLQILPSTIYFVLFPLIAARRRAGGDIQRIAGLAGTLMIAAAFPVVIVGAVFAEAIIGLVYSSAFDDAALMLSVLSLAFVGVSLGYLWTSILLADGPLRVFLIVAAGTAVVSITANIIFIPQFGALGAAWITVGSEMGVAIALGIVAVRRTGLRIPWGRWGRCAVAACVMAAAAFLIRPIGAWVALPISVAVYSAVVFALGGVRPSELVALVRRDPVVLGA